MRDWAGSDEGRGKSSRGGAGSGDGPHARSGRSERAATDAFDSWSRSGAPARPARRARPRAALARRTAAALGAVLALTAAAPAVIRPPRPSDEIARILADSPHQGDCERCHQQHAAGVAVPEVKLLRGPNDNQQCVACHATTWTTGSWAGTALYAGTGHGGAPGMIWPGPDPPARFEPDAAGKCLNCHDPHGRDDATGLIPQLALEREEGLCLACHDGHPAAANVLADLQKPYRHPVAATTGRHAGPGEADPAEFGVTPLNRRHSECVDCHNPHVSRHDAAASGSGEASKSLLGVGRVSAVFGAAGSPPAYAFREASDTLSAPGGEQALCYKCHSSWTTQPAGQTDLARALNPANPSYHPVEAPGRNPIIDPQAFVSGWSSLSTTACGDCHGSDFGTARGPHGSIHRYILKAPYVASPASRLPDPNELCFRCHAYDVYANRDAPDAVQAASRFNRPAAEHGHAIHVGEAGVPCFACHVTHGSATLPHLIVTGRAPGILSYTESSTGGTCAATCHGSQSYNVNYGR
jgi:predicted CXXCH cytochrome family protein